MELLLRRPHRRRRRRQSDKTRQVILTSLKSRARLETWISNKCRWSRLSATTGPRAIAIIRVRKIIMQQLSF